jgi:hypothetical protein
VVCRMNNARDEFNVGVKFTPKEALALLTLVLFSPVSPSTEAETAMVKLGDYCKAICDLSDTNDNMFDEPQIEYLNIRKKVAL